AVTGPFVVLAAGDAGWIEGSVLQNGVRQGGVRRRPPAAAPSNAAGIAACGGRAARALRAPRARPGRGRSWAAARQCRGRRRLGGGTRGQPSAGAVERGGTELPRPPRPS